MSAFTDKLGKAFTRLWPKVRPVLFWHPLGQPMRAWREGKRSFGNCLIRSVAYRVALMPIVIAAAWLVALLSLTHPPRKALANFPEQFCMPYTDVSFTTADGVELTGWYMCSLAARDVMEDDKWKELRPAVVLCHGYGGSRDQLLFPLGQELIAAGYDVLLIDFRGHGRSGGAPVSFGLTEAADVQAAVQFLEDQPGVATDRIGVVGLGMGGHAAILAAPRCSGVKCVVALETYPSVQTLFRHQANRMHAPTVAGSSLAWGMSLYFGNRLLDHNAIESARDFGNRGLLLVSGSADTHAPAEELEPVIAASGAKAARLVVPGAKAGHTLARRETTTMIVRYLDAYLQKSE